MMCRIFGHKEDGHTGVCKRCGAHFNMGFSPCPPIPCACAKCPGVFEFEGSNDHGAFLICSFCSCCYFASKGDRE